MALPAFQSVGSVGIGSTSVTAGLPASLADGDGVLLMVVTKPDTATIGVPTDWTLILDVAGGGGTTGNGVGPTRLAFFFREKSSAWSTMPAVAITNGNSSAAIALRYTKTAGTSWNLTSATGAYGTAATTTDGSATLGSNPGLTAADAVVVGYSSMDEGPTWSAQGVTATGVSAWGTTTEQSEAVETTTGNDVGGMVFTTSVTTGTSSAAPVTAATASIATRGVVGLVRLREVAAGTAHTQTPTDTTGVTDTGTRHNNIISGTDEAGTVDSISSVMNANRTPEDSAGVTETLVVDLAKVLQEAENLTDVANLNQGKSVTDNIQVSDDATVQKTTAGLSVDRDETLNLTDVAEVEFVKAFTDSVLVDEDDVTVDATKETDVDGLSLTDEATIDLILGAITRDETDIVGLSDDIVITYERAITVTDAVVMNDSVLQMQDEAISIVEVTGLADSITRDISAVQQYLDSVGVADTSTMDQAKEVLDAASLTDTVTLTFVRVSTSAETMSLTDTANVNVYQPNASRFYLASTTFQQMQPYAAVGGSWQPSFSRKASGGNWI